MAALAAINAAQNGPFLCTPATLTNADTLTFNANKSPILVLGNTSGSTITMVIDGDGATSVNVDGVGSVAVSGGVSIAVAANTSQAVRLNTIRHFLTGVVNLTGGSGLKAQLFEF